MSDLSDSSSYEEDSDEEIPNISALKPFCFEPELPTEWQEKQIENAGSSIQGASETEESMEEDRIGNNKWCLCGGYCRPMQTVSESLCCRDTN